VSTYDPIERVRQARRQAFTVVALVALAGVLVTIVVVRVVWTGRSGATTPGPAPSAPLVDDGGPDLRWRPFQPGQDLPESLTAGPIRHLDGRAGGFARTELGAALAAIHIGHRIDPTVGSGIFEPTIRDQVVGADAGALRQNLSTSYTQARLDQGKRPGEPLERGHPERGQAQLVAYHVESFGPDAATVAMFTAYEDRTSEFFSFRFDVRWIDEDWRLVAPPKGDISTVFTRLTALPPGAVALLRGT
jgi:hypothetical protein